MKTAKKYKCHIGGKSFLVNDEKTHVYFHSSWYQLQCDIPSEVYFRSNDGSYRYLDSDIIGTED